MALNDMQKKSAYKLGQQASKAPAAPVASAAQPDWKTYADQAQKYLSRPVFQGTPLTGQLLSTAASNTFARTGTKIPLKLALAQAQFESGMGRKGRSPINNPYNVGEFDKKTVRKYPNTQAGVQAYFDLMAKRYLPGGRKLDDLMKSFTWAGNPRLRYASNPQYEQKLKKQMEYIVKFLAERKAE